MKERSFPGVLLIFFFTSAPHIFFFCLYIHVFLYKVQNDILGENSCKTRTFALIFLRIILTIELLLFYFYPVPPLNYELIVQCTYCACAPLFLQHR
jgi:hypothetical protein